MSTSVTSDSRFSRRQRRRRTRTWRPWIIATLLLGLLAGIAWLLTVSSYLAAEQTDVAGERQLSERDVLAAADVALGTPLLRLNLDEIHDRVAAVPEVAAVAVHRSWPNTVRISITEREALAVMRDDGGWWAMDKEGVLFRESTDRTELPLDLPSVEVAMNGDPDILSEVAVVVDALPPALIAKVDSVTARSLDSITLQLEGAREVMWGSSADSQRKAQVINLLLAQSRADIFDVSVPQQPTSRAVE